MSSKDAVVQQKLVAGRKAHFWLTKNPRVLALHVGEWLCLSVGKTVRVASSGPSLKAALGRAKGDVALTIKVPARFSIGLVR